MCVVWWAGLGPGEAGEAFGSGECKWQQEPSNSEQCQDCWPRQGGVATTLCCSAIFSKGLRPGALQGELRGLMATHEIRQRELSYNHLFLRVLLTSPLGLNREAAVGYIWGSFLLASFRVQCAGPERGRSCGPRGLARAKGLTGPSQRSSGKRGASGWWPEIVCH